MDSIPIVIGAGGATFAFGVATAVCLAVALVLAGRNRRLARRIEDATGILRTQEEDRRRGEECLRRALQDAESANRAKSAFLANMSHEIRTPMTSILGFSERLVDARVDDLDRVEAISAIRRNADHLQQIIDDILDISKIEAGMLAIERVPCSVRHVVGGVRSAMEVRAAIEAVRFDVVWKSAVPETIVTDPVRLKQVLLNLVGNAIKFAPRGRVRLEVEFLDSERAPAASLEFTVVDDGIGMDAETLRRLFRPFTQADTTTTRRYGGTGLGLSISKHLVERLGGSIAVDSLPGAGSTFRFRIDAGDRRGSRMVAGDEPTVARGPSAVDPRNGAPSFRGARILLAEDGEDNRRLLIHLLDATGASVDVVEDGAAAVERVRAGRDSGRPYDAILMDMQMPVLDGYGATRELRRIGCTAPILALTAHAMSTDRAKCLEAGCDDFCTKPIVRSAFFGTLARHVRHAMVDSAASGRPEVEAELLELVREFVLELSPEAERMIAAFDAGDLERLAILAHRLKGAAGSYGFHDLTELAAELERDVRTEAPRERIASRLGRVVAECRSARAAARAT